MKRTGIILATILAVSPLFAAVAAENTQSPQEVRSEEQAESVSVAAPADSAALVSGAEVLVNDSEALVSGAAAEPKGEVAADLNTDVAAEPNTETASAPKEDVAAKPKEEVTAEPNMETVSALKEDVVAEPKVSEPSEPTAAKPSEPNTGAAVAAKPRFLPMRHRVDREINKHTFAYKGEVMLGATVSYGTLSNEDTDMYLVLDNLKLKGTMVTVNPFVGYFVADNHVIGLRFGYSHIYGRIGNVTLDLGEKNDIEMSLGNMEYRGDNYSFGVYHRSYVALDAKGRFGLFSEFELLAVTGSQMFRYKSGDEWKETNSDILRVKLNFNPGLAVYIFPNVCGTISFGLGGLQYNSVKQHDAAGESIGSRTTSKMQFRLNIADIRVGMTLHLWNKKKP